MNKRESIAEALALIFQGIERLSAGFPNRKFTLDGRLVGDLGEVIAALEYDIVLSRVQHPRHDGRTSRGRNVQIKATFKDSLTFRTIPDYYLGLKLYPDGHYEEVFNGPGRIIYDRYRRRKGIGVELLSFPIDELHKLSQTVATRYRMKKRVRLSRM